MIDMTQNRVPYGLLTDEEKAVLREHEKAGGTFMFTYYGDSWKPVDPTWGTSAIYRTVPLPLTKDEIAWDRLPDWVQYVARHADQDIVMAHEFEPDILSCYWTNVGSRRRIDDFPGIVLKRGTCDWKDSKQRRPR